MQPTVHSQLVLDSQQVKRQQASLSSKACKNYPDGDVSTFGWLEYQISTVINV